VSNTPSCSKVIFSEFSHGQVGRSLHDRFQVQTVHQVAAVIHDCSLGRLVVGVDPVDLHNVSVISSCQLSQDGSLLDPGSADEFALLLF